MRIAEFNIGRLFSSVVGLLALLCVCGTFPPHAGAENQPVPALTQDDASAGRPFQERRRRQLERREERRKGAGAANRPGAGDGHGRRLANIVNIIATYHEAVRDPHQAAGLAALSIKDAYKKQGKPLDAIPVLEEALGSAKDQQMRNIIMFNIRQVYEEAGQNDKVLEVSKKILKENVGHTPPQ